MLMKLLIPVDHKNMLMKNLYYICLVGLLFISSKLVIAQQDTLSNPSAEFNRYEKNVLKVFNIAGKIPESFTMLKGAGPLKHWSLRKGGHQVGDFIYGILLQSDDKESIIMYPAMPYYQSERSIELAKTVVMVNKKLQGGTDAADAHITFTNENWPYRIMTIELRESLGIGGGRADSLFVVEDYVTTISGKSVREAFNADTVHFYNIPLEEPFQEKYEYCTGMIITSPERASMLFKWYFTKEGKKEEWTYIEQLSGNIWYEDE